MRDEDLRQRLLFRLAQEHGQDPDARVLEELGLCQRDAIIDVALLNGQLHGYELKSDHDTLNRLARQAATYGRVFDTVHLVAGARHLQRALTLVPEWWGVLTVDETVSGLAVVRPAGVNHDVDSLALAQLLWRDEALDALDSFGLLTGFRSKPRCVLWDRLAQNVPLERLSCAVRERLKRRVYEVDSRQR